MSKNIYKDINVLEEESVSRTENSETFVTEDGGRLLVCYPSDKYYQNRKSKHLLKIKNYFFRGEKNEYKYIRDNCFRTEVDCTAKNNILYAVQKDEVGIALRADDRHQKDCSRRVILDDENPAMYGTGDYSVSKVATFSHVFSGADFGFFQAHKRIVNFLYIPNKLDQYTFSFVLDCNKSVISFDPMSRDIRVMTENSKNIAFLLTLLNIVDAAGNEYGGMDWTFEQTSTSSGRVSISCCAEKLNKDEVVFPLKMFFCMRPPENESVVCYSYSEDSHIPNTQFQYNIAKNIYGRCGMRVRIELPTIPKNAIVSQVIFEIKGPKEQRQSPRIEIYGAKAIGDNLVPEEYKALCDIQVLCEEENISYAINITNFLKATGEGKFKPINFFILPSSYGFQTKIPSPYYGGGEMRLIVLYNDEPTGDEYTREYSLENYGIAQVNAYRRNLFLSVKNLQYYETPFALAPLLSYNSKHSDKCERSDSSLQFRATATGQEKVGRGWTFSLFCKMSSGIFVYQGIRFFGYMVTLPDGETVRLREDKSLSLRFFEEGEEYTSYYPFSDLDKKGYVYDPFTRCLSARGEVYKFDFLGRLQEIERGVERCAFEYINGCLHHIADSLQLHLDFRYDNNGFLLEISRAGGKGIKFQYVDGCLSALTFSDGERICFSYYDNPEYLMNSITTVNEKAIIEHRLTFRYVASRITEVLAIKRDERGKIKKQKDEFCFEQQVWVPVVNCFGDHSWEQVAMNKRDQ